MPARRPPRAGAPRAPPCARAPRRQRQRDGPEPHGGPGRLGDRETALDLGARFVGGVLVERARAPRSRDGTNLSPEGSSSPRACSSFDLGRRRACPRAADRVPRRGRRARSARRGPGTLGAQRLRELHRLVGVALDRGDARQPDLRDDEVGIELRRRRVAVARARVAGPLERGAGDELVPGVRRRRPVPARQHRRGAGRVPLEEERRDVRERVLLLGDADVLRARHRVLEGHVCAGSSRDRPSPAPASSRARRAGCATRAGSACASSCCTVGQRVGLAGVELRLHGRRGSPRPAGGRQARLCW